MAEISIGPAENGKEITLGLGTAIALNLPENPTTGYRWRVESGDSLEMCGDEYQSSGTLPGAGGIRHFRFNTLKAGVDEIHAVLRRSWEAGPAQATWSARIRIEPR